MYATLVLLPSAYTTPDGTALVCSGSCFDLLAQWRSDSPPDRHTPPKPTANLQLDSYATLHAMTTKTLLRVEVADNVLTGYETQAARKGKTVEEIVAERLAQFAHVDSTKPLVLEDKARQHVERLLAKNFTTPDEFVSFLQRALQCRVDDVEIPLSPYLLERLKTRCHGMPFDKFLQQTIKRALEEYAGLR